MSMVRILLLFWVLWSLPLSVVAETTASRAPGFSEFDKLDQARKRLEQDQSLTPEEKKQGLAAYDEAARQLQQARDFARRARAFIALRSEAPKKTARIRKRLEHKKPPPKLDRRLRRKPLAELAQLVEARKADLASREAHLKELQQALTRDTERNDAIRQRLAQAKQALEQLQQRLEAAPSPTDALTTAIRWRDRAHRLALSQEIRMLEQELLSLPARKALDQALYDEAQATQARDEQGLEQLQQLLNERRRKEVEQLNRSEAAAEEAVAGQNPLLEQLAAENSALGEALARTTDALAGESAEVKRLHRNDKALQEMFRATREKVEVAGLAGALGQVLLEQRRQLPDLRRLRQRMAEVRRRITDLSLRQIHHREALRRLEEGEVVTWPAGLDPAQRKRLQPQLDKLRARKRQLLEKLVALERDRLKGLTELEAALSGLLHTVQQFDSYLAEHLLWVRNTRVVSPHDLQRLPEELGILFRADAWRTLGVQLTHQMVGSPLAMGVLLLLLAGTLWHGRLRKAIRARAPGAGKPGQGNFLSTLRVLLLSLVLPSWLPAWLAFLYWQLKTLAHPPVYAEGLAAALHWAAPVLYSLLLVRALAMPGGLLQAHFRWKSHTVQRLRRALDPLFFFFVPASMVSILAVAVLPDGLGAVVIKLDFVFIALALTWFLYLALHPRRGVIAAYLDSEPHGVLSRLRWLWFGVLLAVPLTLLGLALAGYVYTAASILRYLVNSLWLIAALVLVHELSEFWLLLTRRRIAYQAALERRRRLEQQTPVGESDTGERPLPDADRSVDLVTLSKESRKLLNAMLFITGAVGLWWIWSPLIPALGVLDQVPLWHQTVTVERHQAQVAVTMGDVLSVLAIIVVTWLAARNLPSLIEILLLQYVPVSAGSRYTIRTLSGYLIAAVGAVAMFKALGGSWAQIQWLVAALGVGIGFGLQEIVANFISGLIILFERPIRVGDFVTVGDTDGTVTRIRIRATTILTRDRKELLVPNKEFITGRLLNWTLSDPTTRLKVVVGVAYGSDLEKAEALMLEAARAHPAVLETPAPWVHFMDFGDSALLLELRCIIDDADRRVRVQSALRHHIDQAFRQAGIEIPFPQRDVHLDLDPAQVAAITPQE